MRITSPRVAPRQADVVSPTSAANASAAPITQSTRDGTHIFVICTAAVGVQCVIQAAAVDATSTDLTHRPIWLGVFAALAATVLFIRGGRGVRVVVALSLGLLGAALGIATSVSHAALAGPAPADYTGAVATVAGLVLIGLAFKLALSGRRMAVKLLLGAVLAFALVEWGLIPAITAGVASNARHPDIPSAASLGLPGARDVSF